METVQIKGLARTGAGKSAARSERRAGRIPAVVYRNGEKATEFAFEPEAFHKAITVGHGRNSLFELDLDGVAGAKTLAVIQEIQRHPTRSDVYHVDFLAVEPEGKVVVDVPIVLVGTPAGVKQGGKMRRHLRRAKVESIVTSIPAVLEVDIAPLVAGQKISLSTVVPPEGSTLVFRHDQPIVSVSGAAAEGAEA